MVVLKILGVLLLLIVLILLIRVGVNVSFGEELRVWVKAGPVTIQIVPKKPGKKKKKKSKPPKEKKPKEKKDEGQPAEKKKKKSLGLTFEDIRSAVPALFESLKRGLRKTRKRVRIHPMTVSVTFGGDDPSKVAEMYGWSYSAMWTLMPQLENLLRMPDPRIHLDVDYNSLRTKAEGEIGISLLIADIFAIGGSFAIPLLKWFLKFRKAKAARDKAAAREAQKENDNKKAEDKGE